MPPLIRRLAQVLDGPAAYRLWQAPFQAAKFAPILRHNDFSTVRRVLDVGCGPGTNCGLFPHAKYLGLDINQRYVAAARRRYGRDFRVADVTKFAPPPRERFDFVLANSLLHHLSDADAASMLASLARSLAPHGHVHIIDLMLPERPRVARFLAKNDRGDFPRSLAAWQRLFKASFDSVVCEPFAVTLFGGVLWELIYFKGRAMASVAEAPAAPEQEYSHAA